jgi:hypothetical protein
VANEVVIRQFMSLNKNNLAHNPRQREFTADLDGEGGPTPGFISATYDGTDVDLSQLAAPGWIDIYNQEPTTDGVTVSWGVYDPETDRYYPVGKLLPGEGTGLFRVDDLLQGEFYPATGSGSSVMTNRLRVKAKDGDVASVVVSAFEE